MSSRWNHLPAPVKNQLAYAYSLARSSHYLAQNLTLPLLERMLVGVKRPTVLERRDDFQQVIQAAMQLIKDDARNIAEGIYPIDVLRPEGPRAHLVRWAKILYDGVGLSKRRKQKRAHDFNSEAQEYLEEVPEYYRRNFHFQTGGYLTKSSAELYEHQVEILFVGAADAMRRLIIPLIKEEIPGDGQGLRFLEVAAGTGRLTRFMKLAFPKARFTVTDVSDPYLKKAQEQLKDLNGIDFVRTSAEELPFKEGRFDFVYSCFLFHELPLNVREEVLREGKRVLKPNGYYGFVDSVQKHDTDFQWALKQFPVDFHEPFYKNYTQHPMESLLEKEAFTVLENKTGFFSKAVLAKAP